MNVLEVWFELSSERLEVFLFLECQDVKATSLHSRPVE